MSHSPNHYAEPLLGHELAKGFLELIKNTPPTKRATRTIPPSGPSGPCYVFLLLPYLESLDYSQYRDVRKQIMIDYCMIAKLDYPEAKDIICLATETKNGIHRSEDLVCLDARDWTNENQLEAIKTKADLQDIGFFGKQTKFSKTEFEYPLPNNMPMKSRNRNDPCPCGSGIKFKYCHGRNSGL